MNVEYSIKGIGRKTIKTMTKKNYGEQNLPLGQPIHIRF